MPELPEVETIVRTLRPSLIGATIHHVSFHRPDILQPAGIDLPASLTHHAILNIARRGKKILLHLDNAHTFIIHLGMTGRLTLDPLTAPLHAHTHLILTLTPPPHHSPLSTHPFVLRFRDPRRFGYLQLLPPGALPDANLGPEPLSLRPTQLQKLLSQTKRPIKSALLDQSLLAGLGNIYVDESLHHARIHPLSSAHKLTSSQIATLNRSIKFVLRRAINARGSTLRDYVDATGQPGQAQFLHKVYARTGKPCLTCKTPIDRFVLTGRSTHFCPNCQKA